MATAVTNEGVGDSTAFLSSSFSPVARGRDELETKKGGPPSKRRGRLDGVSRARPSRRCRFPEVGLSWRRRRAVEQGRETRRGGVLEQSIRD
ncbi:unnamed protein product [Linum trigynum]|uniref:Uncharacterized protein n=1 Tax=Linum trigynum TaxID=586398 RepID=A0AAV2EBR9_9ROSI